MGRCPPAPEYPPLPPEDRVTSEQAADISWVPWELATDWFWQTDATLRIVRLSDNFESSTGISAASVVGTPLTDLLPPDVRPSTTCRTEPFEGVRAALRRDDGSRMWFVLRAIPSFDADGTFQGYRGAATPAPADEAIPYREALDATLSGIAIVSVDPEGRAEVAFANGAFRRMLGFEGDGPIDAPPAVLLAGAVHATETAAALRQPARIVSHEIRRRDESGDVQWLEVRTAPVRGDCPDRRWRMITVHDVTTHKETSLARQQSEERFRDFADATADWLWETDMEQRYTFTTVLGRTGRGGDVRTNLIGVSRWDFHKELTPESSDTTRKIQEFMDRGEPFRGIEFVMNRSNRRPRTFRISGKPIRKADGRIIGYRGTTVEITEQRQMEQALRESEHLFKELADHIPLNLFLKDLDGRYMLVNPTFSRHLGRSPDEVVGRTSFDIFPPDMAKNYEEQDRAVITSGRTAHQVVETASATGGLIWLSITRFLIYDSRGRPVALGCFGLDITAHKRAEEAAKASESRFRDFAEATADWLWESDMEQRFTYVSDNSAFENAAHRPIALLGRTRAEIARMLGSPDDGPAILVQHYMDRHEPFRDIEYMVPGTAGRPLWMRISGKPIRDADGEVVGYRGIASDVTPRRAAESALRESEQRFSEIARRLPAALCVKRLDGRYLFLNQRYAEWFGVRTPEAVGRTSADVFRNELGDRFMERDEEVRRTGNVITAENELTLPDGRKITVSVNKFPIFGNDGAVTGIGAVIMDISARKRMERALVESESRFRDFAEVAADWFWETDMEQRYTYVSQESALAARLSPIVGQASETLAGLTRPDVMRRLGVSDAVIDEIGQLMASGEEFRNFEFSLPNAERGVVWIRISGKPVHDARGTLIAYRGVGADVTERHRAIEAMRAARDAAELANRSKSEFLANVSHELRTPLNAIIGFSQIILDGLFGEIPQAQYRDYIGDIRSSGEHLLQVINDILDIAKIEAGRIELRESEVDLEEILQTSVRLVRERAAEGKLALAVEIPPDMPLVRADAQRMKQILLNLLSNAVKFTRPGGDIHIVVAQETDGIAISVTDTGIGIKPSDIPKALAPFSQIDSRLNRSYQGTGLGLPLAKAFTEFHGGTLTLESEVGKGTCVTIHLPASRIVA